MRRHPLRACLQAILAVADIFSWSWEVMQRFLRSSLLIDRIWRESLVERQGPDTGRRPAYGLKLAIQTGGQLGSLLQHVRTLARNPAGTPPPSQEDSGAPDSASQYATAFHDLLPFYQTVLASAGGAAVPSPTDPTAVGAEPQLGYLNVAVRGLLRCVRADRLLDAAAPAKRARTAPVGASPALVLDGVALGGYNTDATLDRSSADVIPLQLSTNAPACSQDGTSDDLDPVFAPVATQHELPDCAPPRSRVLSADSLDVRLCLSLLIGLPAAAR
jgi:hypothetical protein